MTITTDAQGNAITVRVNGRIDSLTSPELQAAVLDAFQSANSVFLDLAEVAYVSSAGLRILLLGHKTATAKHAVFQVHNVAPSVMAVLDSVGFSKIITIH